MKPNRVFLLILDSVGCGELPDAHTYGDLGCHTLRSVFQSGALDLKNLKKMGLGNIDTLGFLGTVSDPTAAFGKLREISAGKDTVTGHWEIAGLLSEKPMPTYPNGFPQELLAEFSRQTGRGVLCNQPYSGTQVIADYGSEHQKSGALIVYTSADSVFQIAAHESIVPPEELYEYCRIARRLLCGEHSVGRVIARPFEGEEGHYVRTSRRHDFSLEPPKDTLLDALKNKGVDVLAVGKIQDIFAGRGISEFVYTSGNDDGLQKTLAYQKKDFHGLCFVNLVDYDSLYGHRNDAKGYAEALNRFDRWLPQFLSQMKKDDVLMITADHGCDPAFPGTDHTREYTPLLVYGAGIAPADLGTRSTFADIAATIAEWFDVPLTTPGTSFASLLEPEFRAPSSSSKDKKPQSAAKTKESRTASTATKATPENAPLCTQIAEEMLSQNVTVSELIQSAQQAMEKAYAPYSGYQVGAALLTEQGKLYTGCNLENAAYSPTLCAERTAFAKALSEGERHFTAIAIVGGKKGILQEYASPCGVCRQFMREFCSDAFRIFLYDGNTVTEYRLADLLPHSFNSSNLL